MYQSFPTFYESLLPWIDWFQALPALPALPWHICLACLPYLNCIPGLAYFIGIFLVFWSSSTKQCVQKGAKGELSFSGLSTRAHSVLFGSIKNPISATFLWQQQNLLIKSRWREGVGQWGRSRWRRDRRSRDIQWWGMTEVKEGYVK